MFNDLNSIYKIFQSLDKNEKVQYLKELETQKLPYNINFDNLIKVWSR